MILRFGMRILKQSFFNWYIKHKTMCIGNQFGQFNMHIFNDPLIILDYTVYWSVWTWLLGYVKTEMSASILLVEQPWICIIDHFLNENSISPNYIVIHCVDRDWLDTLYL